MGLTQTGMGSWKMVVILIDAIRVSRSQTIAAGCLSIAFDLSSPTQSTRSEALLLARMVVINGREEGKSLKLNIHGWPSAPAIGLGHVVTSELVICVSDCSQNFN